MSLFERQPLRSFASWEARSLSDARSFSESNFPRVLSFDSLNGRKPFRIRDAHVMLDSVKLMSVASTGHRIRLVDHDKLGVLIPLMGRIGVEDGRSENSAGPGELLLPGPGQRTTTVSENYLGLVALLPRALLESHVGQSEAPEAAARLNRLGRLDARSGPARSLAAYLHFLVGELDQGGTLTHSLTARRAAGSLLLEHVIAIVAESDAAANAGKMATPSPWQIARAEDYIEAHLSGPLTVTEVAASIGTSTRALQWAFQRYRGQTPYAFIQERRLEHFHRVLCRAAPPATVTSIALDCGFTHVGRLAQCYRMRFGESPLETLRRSR